MTDDELTTQLEAEMEADMARLENQLPEQFTGLKAVPNQRTTPSAAMEETLKAAMSARDLTRDVADRLCGERGQEVGNEPKRLRGGGVIGELIDAAETVTDFLREIRADMDRIRERV